ncbi:MAG: hybrid sensor histidine kinase/response regulator [Ramlibacter sp.]
MRRAPDNGALHALEQAERALNASESQLAAVIDAVADAIVTVDADGNVLLFNQGASRMFGCGRAGALGAGVERWLPEAMDCIRGLQGGDGGVPGLLARALPLQARREDGASFLAEASVARIDDGGRPLYTLTVRDLTPALAVERERQLLEMQLRQSQKMEALGTLAGGIAHDFNNIVAAILGNARLARDRSAADAPVQPFVAEITRAGLRARDLVQRILAFSRNQPPDFSVQPLEPLVREGVQLLRAMLPSGIELVHEAASQAVIVRADATQVSQVLMNLGTNAWQAIGPHPGRITVWTGTAGSDAVIEVADTGCGMDEHTVERMFEPFFTTKAQGEGTGLGLPVVHGIVRAHGGRIDVESRPGQGSTFRIHLPLAPAGDLPSALPCGDRPPVAKAPPAPAGGRHVVYLDDYPAMVLMVRAILEAQGYRVTGFEDPQAALGWLQAHAGEADLVVSDYNMPGCSGLELAARLRELRPQLPVILASGYITDDLRQAATEVGVRHLFDKPRGVEELCGLVDEVLRGAVRPAEAVA